MWLVVLWYSFYWGGLKPNSHNSEVRLYCSIVVLMCLSFKKDVAVVTSWYIVTWPSCSLFYLPVSLSLSTESVKMGMLIYSSGLLSMSLWYLYRAFTCFFFPPCTYCLHYPLFNLPEPRALHQQFERNKLCLIFLIGVLWKSNNMKYVWQNCVNGTHTHIVLRSLC